MIERKLFRSIVFSIERKHQWNSFIHGWKFSQIPAFRLFFFNRDEQGFEISFAEAFAAFSLQDFKENRRAVLGVFAEDLQ